MPPCISHIRCRVAHAAAMWCRKKTKQATASIRRHKAKRIQQAALRLLLEQSAEVRLKEAGWRQKVDAAAVADAAAAAVAGQAAQGDGNVLEEEEEEMADGEQRQEAGSSRQVAQASDMPHGQQRQGQRRRQIPWGEREPADGPASKKTRIAADSEWQAMRPPQQQQGQWQRRQQLPPPPPLPPPPQHIHWQQSPALHPPLVPAPAQQHQHHQHHRHHHQHQQQHMLTALPAGQAAAAEPAGPAVCSGSGERSCPGLPGPGLRLLTTVQEVQQLVDALLASNACIGFALHLAPGTGASSPGMAGRNSPMVEMPLNPREREQKQNQEQKQGTSPPAAGTLLGLAVSWWDGAAAYISLRPRENGASSSRSTGGGDGSFGNHPGIVTEVCRLLSGGDAAVSGGGGPLFRATIGMQQQALALLGLLGLRVALPPQLVDVRLAGWLLDPERSTESADGPIPRLKVLKALLARTPGGISAYDAACAGLAPLSPMQQQPGAGCVEACRAAAASRAAWRLQLPQLQRLPELLSALVEQEMPLAAILAGMESRGIGISAAALEQSKCLASGIKLPTCCYHRCCWVACMQSPAPGVQFESSPHPESSPSLALVKI